MKFVIYFRTKCESFPTPFKKIRLPKHDRALLKCYAAIVDEQTEERVWNLVFTCCHDYQSAGETKCVQKVRDPENPSQMVDETLEMIAKRV